MPLERSPQSQRRNTLGENLIDIEPSTAVSGNGSSSDNVATGGDGVLNATQQEAGDTELSASAAAEASNIRNQFASMLRTVVQDVVTEAFMEHQVSVQHVQATLPQHTPIEAHVHSGQPQPAGPGMHASAPTTSSYAHVHSGQPLLACPGMHASAPTYILPPFVNTPVIHAPCHVLQPGSLPTEQHMSSLGHDSIPSIQMPSAPVRCIYENSASQRQFSPYSNTIMSQSRFVELPKFAGDPRDWPVFERTFVDTTAEFSYSNTYNIIRLRQALTGNARSSVESLLPFPESVQEIMATLKQNFGRSEQMVNRSIAEIRRTSVIQPGNYAALVTFANTVRNLAGFMKYAQAEYRMYDTTLVMELVAKLPDEIQMQWAAHQEGAQGSSIVTLSEFLNGIARRANMLQDSLAGVPAVSGRTQGSSRRKHTMVARVENSSCVHCEKACASLSECAGFKKLSVKLRWQRVKSLKLCFGCLSDSHGLSNCNDKVECKINGCKKYHHSLLHYEPESSNNASTSTKTDNRYNAEAVASDSSVLFQIVPVTVTVGGKSCRAYAFIDHGSSHSMVDLSFAEKLGMEGEKVQLAMQWLGNVSSNQASSKVSFQIQGCSRGCRQFRMTNVYTVRNLNLPRQSANVKGLHYDNAKPVILIGLDHAHLTTTISKPIVNSEDQPIVVRTRLGTVAYGRISAKMVLQHEDNTHVFVAVSVKRKMEDLEQLLGEYFAGEGVGDCRHSEKLLSDEEAIAMQMMQKNTKYVNERYEVGLLWKGDRDAFPPTREMALRRLKGVETKMKINKEFAKQYVAKMESYLHKGYARKLSAEEIAKTSKLEFYLPHFAVCNPNKKSLRIVFDAAAEVKGVSLNKALMAGPDLNQSLLSILFKFRQRGVAVCGDIKEMFLQITVRKEDQNAQRFLWRENGNDKEVSTYVMERMLFGAKCSPTLAQYVKNTNADKHSVDYPRATDAIKNKHYVDDYVDCFDSKDEAIKIVKNVIAVHKKGGFELRGIVSNSEEVMQRIGGDQPESDLVTLNKTEVERVLGMFWNYKNDYFSFELRFHKVSREVVEQRREPTKREVLCLIMSVFDPFGILGDFMISGKLLMQELWKAGTLWDESIPENLIGKWKAWLSQLLSAENVRVPRCYHLKFTSASSKIELHVFADASENAMATVAYFRIREGYDVVVRFAFAKTRCAPLKYVTIPRMELQAAVMAVRIKEIVANNHNIRIERTVFWTDSTTVVAWIRSSSRDYKQYVANRISEILDHSTTNEWRWLPGTLNPADEGTRALYDKRKPDGQWLRGPTFLKQPECDWPAQPDVYSDAHNGSELKVSAKVLAVSKRLQIVEFSRYSSLRHLVRIFAWVLRFGRNHQSKTEPKAACLSMDELNEAELLIARYVQQTSFEADYYELLNGRPVSQAGSLSHLNPYVDEKGVMRVHGRLERAVCLTAAEKRLIILPKSHEYTALVVRHYHEKFRHINRELIISEIRRKYWVPSVRTELMKCERRCNSCKIRRAVPKQPIMGALPPDRVTPYIRPFTYTGLDYFGPVLITVHRRKEKRWVALFTCLTIRAVHLELAADLSSDACLLCIRNFVNRRGVPVQIRSDNGTNFQGIKKELKGTNDFMDNSSMTDKCAGLGIRWVFNCPANPSEGGAWERLVQSVKKALMMILKETAPKIEVLNSALIEAENIVNSRPLTHLPVSIDEQEPLTPNHFLLNTANSTQTPGEDGPRSLCSRKQWRIAQTLKNGFWKRWVAEYLPELTRRSKWCQPTAPVTVGSLVLICDAALPRSEWKRGRVTALFYGNDGVPRSANVKTSQGELKRPLSKLAKLDIEGDGEAPGRLTGAGMSITAATAQASAAN